LEIIKYRSAGVHQHGARGHQVVRGLVLKIVLTWSVSPHR